jgi:hypothetical protein
MKSGFPPAKTQERRVQNRFSLDGLYVSAGDIRALVAAVPRWIFGVALAEFKSAGGVKFPGK